MKAHERVAMLYTLGLAGAAGISYYRGRRGAELVREAAVYGLVAGTALNVGGWLLLEGDGLTEALPNPLPNPMALLNKAPDMGKMSSKAIQFLSDLDEGLYDDFKENGVKVGLLPPNPSIVTQDLD